MEGKNSCLPHILQKSFSAQFSIQSFFFVLTGDINMPKPCDWMLNSTTQANTRLRRRIRNEKNVYKRLWEEIFYIFSLAKKVFQQGY